VLKGVSFEVDDGEFCILLGPSGCGKTTLLRLVAGLEEASAGTISVGRQAVDRLPPRERDVAFVFQSYALYPHMSVFENLAFSLRLRRLAASEVAERVREAARLLEIEELLERKPQQLSGGQRQRVAVGRAIVRRPKIFLFDEPLSNLDAALRASMRIELARLHQRLGATMLYVTHDQAEAMTLGEKVIVLDRGEIQQMAAPSEVYRRPGNLFVAGFVGSPQMNFFQGALDERGEIFTGRGVRIDLGRLAWEPAGRYAGKRLTAGIRPEDLRAASDDEAWIRAHVEWVEDLGADRFLRLRSDDVEVVARMAPDGRSLKGETISLAAPPDRLHLFFEGKRIN
jgi:multiple sugar transport system ATP-binding protein